MSFVIYARGHRPPDQYPRDHVVVFPEAPQARVWLQLMEQNLPPGFTLRSAQMDAIRAAPNTNWQLDDEHDRWIRRFKYGTWDEVHAKDEPEVADAKEVQRSLRRERSARAQRPDGYVTITELCASSDILPMHARAALRASGMEKPEYGWAFAPDQIPSIKKLCGIKS